MDNVKQHPTGGAGTTLGTTLPGAAMGMGTTLADRDLPSVMTCANYLKLPPYSCKVFYWVEGVPCAGQCENRVLDCLPFQGRHPQGVEFLI